MNKKLLTIKEAAAILGITDIQVRNLIRGGKIPFVNVGAGTIRRAIRIEESALKDFINDGGSK